MVPGQSRLGRIKIPTCIACDRPLLNKVNVSVLGDILIALFCIGAK